MKKTLLAAAALGFMSLGLAACGDSATTQPDAQVDGIPGIAVTNARLVLPAVAGNPGAVYFDIKNDSNSGVALRTADVAGAKSAMMHEMAEWSHQMQMTPMDQLIIDPAKTVKFEPGAYHIMAMELDPSLAAGGSTEITLTFLGGDKISFPAAIKAAGDDR